jgi:alpha-L-fucosidase
MRLSLRRSLHHHVVIMLFCHPANLMLPLPHSRFFMIRNFIFALICCSVGCFSNAQQAMPTPLQLDWHRQEFYLFMHYGPNTFTGKEWGDGKEATGVFNPTAPDCQQWCRIAKAAGAKGIIITAKHHDGFCLWPSNYSTHTVAQSAWQNGKGDVLRDLSEACKEAGLKFGVYLSPWDRNHPDYGTEKYNDVFVNMLTEVLTSYGPVWELWWDGANGEGPNGKKQVYDWERYKQTVKKLSPQTLVFSDVGPHIRWCGNEKGIAGATNWNYLDTVGFTPGIGAPHTDTLTKGNVQGKYWIPAECDVSIRPGWFYRKSEDTKVKTPRQLFDIYCNSVGRGANLLLNVPPDTRGRIHEKDSAALLGFAQLRTNAFAKNLLERGRTLNRICFSEYDANALTDGDGTTSLQTNKDAIHDQDITFWLQQPGLINCVVLEEDITNGQSIARFRVDVWNGKKKVARITATTMGRKRILRFPAVKADRIMLTILETKEYKTSLAAVAAYRL